MPWDYDLDVQMPTATLGYLGRHYNRTVHDYRFPVEKDELVVDVGVESNLGVGGERGEGVIVGDDAGLGYVNKTYLLDVNPHYADLGRGNGANVIDARWIDVSTGLFVDITGLFVDITGLAEREPADRPGVWSCKNAHRYRTAELFPMRRTEFEGVPASIPYAFDKILTDEYGAKSLTGTEWAGHRWVPELKEWVKLPEPLLEEEADKTTLDKQQQDSKAVVVVVEKTVVKGAE
ncbi:LicD family-domain-containing protein [Hypomontagnella submonticulosa]|nr:LicD family-domain-containing protein [Hypomontagnella submonticulosa]